MPTYFACYFEAKVGRGVCSVICLDCTPQPKSQSHCTGFPQLVTASSIIRSHHVYKVVLSPFVGEEQLVQCEVDKIQDDFAVSYPEKRHDCWPRATRNIQSLLVLPVEEWQQDDLRWSDVEGREPVVPYINVHFQKKTKNTLPSLKMVLVSVKNLVHDFLVDFPVFLHLTYKGTASSFKGKAWRHTTLSVTMSPGAWCTYHATYTKQPCTYIVTFIEL